MIFSRTARLVSALVTALSLWVLAPCRAQTADPDAVGTGKQEVRNPGAVSHPQEADPAAARLFAAGRFALARAAYAADLRRDPSLIEAHVGLIRSMLRQDRWEDAQGAARTAVKAAPQSADLHGLLALTLMRAGLPDVAAVEAARARALDADNYWGLVATGRIAAWNWQNPAALEALRRATTLQPDWPEAWYYLVDAANGDDVTQTDLDDLESYLRLHAKGHPFDLANEALPSRMPLLRSLVGDTPFHAVSPVTQTEMLSADRGETQKFTLTVPIERSDGYIVLPVVLEGRKLRMLFDTGGGSDITLNQSVANQLKLPLLARSSVYGVSGKEPAQLYKADALQIGTETFGSIPISSIAGSVGTFDGIMGVNALDQYVITADLKRNLLTLARGKDIVAPAAASGNHLVTIPFHYFDGNIVIPAVIDGQPDWAIVDTGADNYALLSLHRARQIASERPRQRSREGAVAGKVGIGTTAMQQRLLVLSDPVSLRLNNQNGALFKVDIDPAIGASLMDSQVDAAIDFELDTLLGITFLVTAERITFDYPHRLLTLEVTNSGK